MNGSRPGREIGNTISWCSVKECMKGGWRTMSWGEGGDMGHVWGADKISEKVIWLREGKVKPDHTLERHTCFLRQR